MTKELYIPNTTIRYLFYLLMSLSTTIEVKDKYARGHSHRVAEYALACLEQAIHEKNPQDRHLYPLLIRYMIRRILYQATNIAQSCIQMIESFSHSC